MKKEFESVVAGVWNGLTEACNQGEHGWRFGSLATVDSRGLPRVRKVVLREARQSAGQLLFYTDPRSAKWMELTMSPGAEVLFWSAEEKQQLRCRGVVSLHQGDELARVHQEKLPQHVAGDYAASQAPGEALEEVSEGWQLGESWHFGVLVLTLEEMDWLELSRAGHRRLGLCQKEKKGWSARWLQP